MDILVLMAWLFLASTPCMVVLFSMQEAGDWLKFPPARSVDIVSVKVRTPTVPNAATIFLPAESWTSYTSSQIDHPKQESSCFFCLLA